MNQLAHETSPYLLQHKNNPVEWHAWNNAAWERAKTEDKMVLVSIGYSACHWCHVMEHEVFEDFECAEFMNRHFICIKVDREERPDIDAIYMDAIHLMGSKGGWPLNVFALPDGRPIYGGTYFPKQGWLSILENLVDLYRTDREKVRDYANRLHSGIIDHNIIESNPGVVEFSVEFLDRAIEHWSAYWDMVEGGTKRAPKFPMPSNLELSLHYGILRKDSKSLEFVKLTLEKMAMRGIYDQVGGGFSRYSVDDRWKVPHFEKMLYDNAQLISLYAQAYRHFGDQLFADVVLHVIEWAERELKSDEGLFFSALDADSEGVEGKFYTWTEEEIRSIAGPDSDFAMSYYSIGKDAFWEHNQNILLRSEKDEFFAEFFECTAEDIRAKRTRLNQKLLAARDKRIRPGLDDKCLTSWNALMVVAYCDVFKALGNDEFISKAKDLFEKIISFMGCDDDKLMHAFTKGHKHIEAFLDDYALMAKAALEIYEASGDEFFLSKADMFVKKAIALFYNPANDLFFFAELNEQIIVRKQEIQDNVMPSSNSVMCSLLFRLSVHLENEEYREQSLKMLQNILPSIDIASAYSNWLLTYLNFSCPYHQMAICGPDAHAKWSEVNRKLYPNTLVVASTHESELPLLKNRFNMGTAIYVCTGKTCLAPVYKITEALRSII